MNMLRDMLEDWPGRLLLLLTVALAATISLAMYAMYEEAKEWASFAKAHDCRVVGRMSGTTSTGLGVGVMPNGQVGTVMTTSTTPAKTGYACNDGVTYWR